MSLVRARPASDSLLERGEVGGEFLQLGRKMGQRDHDARVALRRVAGGIFRAKNARFE